MSERVSLDEFEAVADLPPDAADSRTPLVQTASAVGSSRPVPESDTSGSPGTPPSLASDSNILGRFRSDLARAGVAGEEGLSQIVYLAMTSRLLPWGHPTERPVSLLLKGTSSSGKSFATSTTLRFFPEESYVSLGSMSRRFLFYDEEPLAHRFLIVPEWATIAGDEELVAMLRVLLSEGRIVHGTVDLDGRSRIAKRIEKDGPMGLIVTTTAAAVDPEMETRCLSLLTDDSREQTRRVYASLARLEHASSGVDFEAWHELQKWLADHEVTPVVLPFVEALADAMPDHATRLRRDFATLLSLVRAHANLYRAQREFDSDGRLIASLEGDYAPVRDLINDVIAQGVEASVSDATHATVDAVREIIEEGAEYATPSSVAPRLEIGRSATYDRIKRALISGHLTNIASRNERAMKLTLGAALPLDDGFLPTTEMIVRAASGRNLGHARAASNPGSGSRVRASGQSGERAPSLVPPPRPPLPELARTGWNPALLSV